VPGGGGVVLATPPNTRLRLPQLLHRRPLPKDHRKSRVGRDRTGWCRPKGPTPRWRSRTAQYGSYRLSPDSQSSATDERTPNLHPFSQQIRHCSETLTPRLYSDDFVEPVKTLSEPEMPHQRASERLRSLGSRIRWVYTLAGEVPSRGSAIRRTKARGDLRRRCGRLQPRQRSG
jgi:hypothetical protein